MNGTTKCEKCASPSFVLIGENKILNSEMSIAFVQCSECRAAAGVMLDATAAGSLIQMERRLKVLEESTAHIEGQLSRILRAMGH